jgi:tetratricopeptide (TPR) repeat protein
MTCSEVHTKALELVQQAMNRQMAGEIEDSIELYRESIALHPTADAHTYLGWAYSFQGLTKLLRNAKSPFSSIPSSAIPTTISVFI